MPRITDVVKHLLIINVLLFFITQTIGASFQANLMLFNPFSQNFQPYQIVTHMFMHAGFGHLFFNMFALFMFGTALESFWGPKRFLFFYLFTGFGAMVFHFLVWFIQINVLYGGTLEYEFALREPNAILGASGAVFGLLAGFGMLFPNTRLMLLFPPIPMKAKYFVAIYGAIELFAGVTNTMDGIAHFAHIGGALFGIGLILFWRYKRT